VSGKHWAGVDSASGGLLEVIGMARTPHLAARGRTTPGAAAICSGLRQLDGVDRAPKMAGSSFTRFVPRAGGLSERRGGVSSAHPCWRWNWTAKRWASSRRRAQQLGRPNCSGVRSPTQYSPRQKHLFALLGQGSKDHSSRASPETHAGPPFPAESWPCPPSIITTFGPVAETSVFWSGVCRLGAAARPGSPLRLSCGPARNSATHDLSSP